MMYEDAATKRFFDGVHEFTRMLEEELHDRWKQWKIDLGQYEMYETIGALLARQLTLAIEIARAPSIWNGHIAPIILRTMADTYITLAWILENPKNRTKQFIRYGLGREKLEIEHLKREMDATGSDSSTEDIIQAREAWVNSQRYTSLTEVNVGSWTGSDTRTMAQEAACEDFYNFVYTPFSAATHSMWHHVGRYNLSRCTNPLHRFHYIPSIPDLPIDVNYLYLAGKYVEKSLNSFDRTFSIVPACPSSFEHLVGVLQDLDPQDTTDVSDPTPS